MFLLLAYSNLNSSRGFQVVAATQQIREKFTFSNCNRCTDHLKVAQSKGIHAFVCGCSPGVFLLQKGIVSPTSLGYV